MINPPPPRPAPSLGELIEAERVVERVVGEFEREAPH